MPNKAVVENYPKLVRMKAQMAIEYAEGHRPQYMKRGRSQVQVDVALLKGMLVHHAQDDIQDIIEQTDNLVQVCVNAERL